MLKSIASIYPCPFDSQIRHELNCAIYNRGKIFAYEEGKVSTLKDDGLSSFPERSLFLGFKELATKPSEIDLWVLPKPHKVDFERSYLFFNFIKAYKGKKIFFKKWVRKKIKLVKHHDLHTYSAIKSSGLKKSWC